MFSEWLVLGLGIPLILVPFVLLFGFAGCGLRTEQCFGDEECGFGERCEDNWCVPTGGDGEGPSLAAPQHLEAYAVHDTEIDVSWTADNEPAATSFKVQRVEEGDPWSTATEMETAAQYYNDAMGLKEGITYLYQVAATDGQNVSNWSNETSATTFPKTPSSLIATPVTVDQVDLNWTNESAKASQFSLQHRLKGASTWEEIYPLSDTSYSHTGLAEGTDYEYQVLAVIPVGFQNDEPGRVYSEPSPTTSARTWTLAFSASLTDPQAREGYCLIQRISAAQFVPFPTELSPTMVRLTLASSGLLTLNGIYLSQVAPSGDPWDAGADLTKVVDVSQGDPPAVLQGNSSLVLGPVDYALDRTQDLLVAFDISATTGQGNVISIAQSGATYYFKAATQAASVSDRPHFTTGHDLNYLVERIEVL